VDSLWSPKVVRGTPGVYCERGFVALLDDEAMVDENAWLNELPDVTHEQNDALNRAGCFGASLGHLLDQVARQLNIPTAQIGVHGYLELARAVEPLIDLVAEGAGDVWSDVEDRRGERFAEAVVRTVDRLDVLHGALIQFGFGKRKVAGHKIAETRTALQDVLQDELRDRARKMLEQWRKRGVWAEEPPKERVVRATTRKAPRGKD
jgi:hypothetical protein